jgi:RNA polymerase sigma-70 factor (ECF subfamily)
MSDDRLGGRSCEQGALEASVMAKARAGDKAAFGDLVAPVLGELKVHCYRMLGTLQDAEDVLQETLLAAWKGLPRLEGGRSSLRGWLYTIATNRCLNVRRARSRRPKMDFTTPHQNLPAPTRLGEIVWVEPIPDAFLEEIADSTPGPEARYESREAISLAFITALQRLSPRQRSVLILRDVLGFRAAEVAHFLDSSEESVTSALKRARATLSRERLPEAARVPAVGSPAERDLVERFARAFEENDVSGLVALLTEDVRLTMPPLPLEYEGREQAARFLTAVIAWGGPEGRLVPTRANRQPAFGLYVRDPRARVLHAVGLLVLTFDSGHISALTRFDNSVLPSFGLRRTLPD